MTFPESDWRLLRSVHRAGIDRYCTRVLEECAATIRRTDISAHERYLTLFRLMRDRDKSIAIAFDDMRRSRAVERLAEMILLGVVTDEELSQFSTQTRESAKLLAEFSRSTTRRH